MPAYPFNVLHHLVDKRSVDLQLLSVGNKTFIKTFSLQWHLVVNKLLHPVFFLKKLRKTYSSVKFLSLVFASLIFSCLFLSIFFFRSFFSLSVLAYSRETSERERGCSVFALVWMINPILLFTDVSDLFKLSTLALLCYSRQLLDQLGTNKHIHSVTLRKR